MAIKLSICIPTYNREKYLTRTLHSIASQLTPEVEVVIADNASIDKTEEVIKELESNFPHLTYYRWAENMGADKNFLKVIDLAQGEYCWFLGSDDKIEDGCIALIIDKINQHHGLAGISVNVQAYDPELLRSIHAIPPTSFCSDVVFKEADKCFSILGLYFGYISAQIVNRKDWNLALKCANSEPYQNAYVHVYVIAKMLRHNPHWLYCAHKCVGWRSGNDSFLKEGRLRRLEIDVVGYEKIGGDIFGRNSKTYHALMQNLSTGHVRSALLQARTKEEGPIFYWRAAIMTIPKYWKYPNFWLKTAPFLMMPRFLFLLIRFIHRLKLKTSRD